MSMKVLIISDAWHPQINGVVRTYEYLLQELDQAGYESCVIGPQDFAITMPMPFYPEIRLVLGAYPRLKKLIEAFNPDRIHIATEGPLGWAARKYCLKAKRNFTTSYHTQFPDYVAKRFAWLFPPLYRLVHRLGIANVRYFHKPSTAVMISTNSLAEQLRSWGFKQKLSPLTRGVDYDVFNPAPSDMLNHLPRPIALYVGRIAIEKNLEDFLKMPWEGSKVLVGDGPVLADLQYKFPKAHFVGKKTGRDLAQYYRASDVFVFPSRTDTFGIVLIEALACGLPVAGYNVIGPKDIISEPFLGCLDDHDLSKAAHQAIKQGDPEKCAAHARANYSWQTAGQQFMDAI